MKPLKKMPLIFTLTLVGYLLLNTAPAARAFMSFYHDWGAPMNGRDPYDKLLIHKVHAPFWTIHYSFENCGEVDEETQKKYTQMLTTHIQSWLQPLRAYADRPIVNDFRYRLSDDWKGADFGIITTCGEIKRSFAHVGGSDRDPGLSPEVCSDMATYVGRPSRNRPPLRIGRYLSGA